MLVRVAAVPVRTVPRPKHRHHPPRPLHHLHHRRHQPLPPPLPHRIATVELPVVVPPATTAPTIVFMTMSKMN